MDIGTLVRRTALVAAIAIAGCGDSSDKPNLRAEARDAKYAAISIAAGEDYILSKTEAGQLLHDLGITYAFTGPDQQLKLISKIYSGGKAEIEVQILDRMDSVQILGSIPIATVQAYISAHSSPE